MSYVESAFQRICQEAKQPDTWFVCLLGECQQYGGPEEGGWYYPSSWVVEYQQFPTKEAAEFAAEQCKSLAKEMQRQDLNRHGDHCLETLEWLESGGLEPDCMPEPDGPNHYWVAVFDEIPVYDNRRPQYS